MALQTQARQRFLPLKTNLRCFWTSGCLGKDCEPGRLETSRSRRFARWCFSFSEEGGEKVLHPSGALPRRVTAGATRPFSL